MSLEKFTLPSVVDNEETRAALKRARDELMTPAGPELVVDLLEGTAAHAELIKLEQNVKTTKNS
jgi:hypothetical protein